MASRSIATLSPLILAFRGSLTNTAADRLGLRAATLTTRHEAWAVTAKSWRCLSKPITDDQHHIAH